MNFLRQFLIATTAETQTTPRQPRGMLENVRRLSGYSWLIILLGLVMITGLWLFVSYRVNNEYKRAIAEASQETMNLAIAYEENVHRIIAEADKDLLSLKRAYEKDGLASPLIADFVENAAEDRARNQVAFYNEHGFLVNNSAKLAPIVNYSDREYFKVHRDAAMEALYIGQPIRTKLLGWNSIPLSRRINKPDGAFAGVVYIGLRTDYFLEFYKKMNLGPDQVIDFVGLDWIVRARQSRDHFDTGQDLTNSQLYQNVRKSPCGTYMATSVLDGVQRIVSYRVMPDYPLVFAIGKSTEVALAGFEQSRQRYILGALLLSFSIVISCFLLISRGEKQRTIKRELERQVDERTRELRERDKELFEANCKLIATGEAIKAEKEHLTALVNSIRDEVWFIDTKRQVILANSPLFKEAGFAVPANLDEVIDSLEMLRADATTRPDAEAPLLRGLRGESIANEREIVRSPASGEWRHRAVSVNPAKDAEGTIIGAVAVVRDITERIAMESELEKAREDRFKKCIENMHDCFVIYRAKRDESGRIVDFIYEYFNDAARENLNLRYDQNIGRGFLELHPKSIMFEQYCRVVETGEPLESEIVINSAEEMTAYSGIYEIRVIKLGDGVALFARNVTEKKNYEKELARLDRLNLVGEMAASIGHEVRNPLTAIRGYLQYFERKKEIAQYRSHFQTMIDELDRANGIISEFLSLANNKTVALKPQSLNAIINAILPLLQSEALRDGHNIRVDLADVPDINLDEKEIRQLILNLARNGFEAMEAGGLLTIGTYTEDDKVVLTVRDTGTGIPKAVLDKLGTPFLTTKDKGTGLGLPVCYRVAEHHGAKISVATGLEGTTFTVSF